jgi:hypothetical protein
MPNKGDLKVWWIPQVPMNNPFEYPVKSPEEAAILCDALAKYDLFQHENNIKPDFSNAGGLVVYDLDSDGEGKPGWVDWYTEDDDDFDCFMDAYLSGRSR